jgi:hypothetical protein
MDSYLGEWSAAVVDNLTTRFLAIMDASYARETGLKQTLALVIFQQFARTVARRLSDMALSQLNALRPPSVSAPLVGLPEAP